MLRHGQKNCCPAIDCNGWASVESLAQSINRELGSDRYWRNLQAEDLIQIAAQHEDRLEVDFPRIRARYGHSLFGINPGVIAHPPATLLHVTRRSKVESIQKVGLHPQGRNFVHLTNCHEYAAEINNNVPLPDLGVALIIETPLLAKHGLQCYQASDHVWLTSHVPVNAISMKPNQGNSQCTQSAGEIKSEKKGQVSYEFVDATSM